MKNNINDVHSFNSALMPDQIQMLRSTILQRLRIEEPTLRDQFAMASLTGIIQPTMGTWNANKVAQSAYMIADAMLIARKDAE